MSLREYQDWPIEKLVPHERPMLLLDRVVEMSEDSCECEVALTAESAFCVGGRVGAWFGLEYMAQTVAAFAGAQGLADGNKIRVGLLLGTRSFVAHIPYFEAGTTLRIRSVVEIVDPNGLSVLNCVIRDSPTGQELARATLTVYQIESLARFLAEQSK